MALADYPAGLPYDPGRDGFARAHHLPALSFPTEDGPPITRLQASTAIKQFSYRLIFTDAELATWHTFAETTLVRGTLHYLMPVPLVGRTFVTRRVYLENADWNDEPFGEHWAVSFKLNAFVAAP